MNEKAELIALLDGLLHGLEIKSVEIKKPRNSQKIINIDGNIERVILNNPATVVFWKDGTKSVVKCQDGEEYDPEKGLALAIIKRLCGNTGSYYEIFKKYIPDA